MFFEVCNFKVRNRKAMGSRCLPKTDKKYVTKPIHFFMLNSTAWSLILVKWNKTMLSCSVLCYMRTPPMFPNLGHVRSLICLPHFENISSLCFLLSGLIDGPLTSIHLAWMWPDSISHPLIESPQWPEVRVQFLCSVPISPCYTKPWPGARTIPRVFLAETK